jgi:hypothetical protein
LRLRLDRYTVDRRGLLQLLEGFWRFYHEAPDQGGMPFVALLISTAFIPVIMDLLLVIREKILE